MKRKRPRTRARGRRPGAPATPPLPRLVGLGLPALVVLLVFAAFLPTLRNGFVNWDDHDNFVDDPHYRGLGSRNLLWMFTTFHTGPYQPLSWMTLAVDYLVWGLDPVGYHLTGLVLHAANAVLVYRVALVLLARAVAPGAAAPALGWGALVAALAFALHPLRVESVAWATERRDVLSGLFSLLTVLAYVRMADERSRDGRGGRWLAVALAGFALSLLAKGSGMTLPLALLVLDAYPLRRPLGVRILLEKVPFAALSAGAAILAWIGQRQIGALQALAGHDLAQRAAVALYGLAFYVGKTVWPVGLSPLYPLELDVRPLDPKYLVAGAVVATITAALLRWRRPWPAGLAAWGAYVAILLPVLGLAQSGSQIAADRYTYLATIPFALLAGAGARRLADPIHPDPLVSSTRRVLTAALAAGLLVLGASSFRQTLVWKDSLTLWRRALALGHENAVLRNRYADALKAAGDRPGALRSLARAIALNPRVAHSYNARGLLRLETGDVRGAFEDFDAVVRILPNAPIGYANRGLARLRQGDVAGAARDLERAQALGRRGG